MPFQVDQIADASKVELVRLARQYEFPEFVKKAGIEQTMSAREVPVTAYADTVRKQFPCDTAASTWLSTLYYQEKAAEFHSKDRQHIERRLEHFADYWRIKPACDAIRTRWTELHKTSAEKLPDSAFAYVWVGDNGTKDRRLCLTTAAEVKAAADYVLKHRDYFPYPVRHTMSKRILEKAAHFGAWLGDTREFLEKQAGMGVCDPAAVVAMVEQRAYLVQNQELRKQFTKMAATIKTLPRQALQPGTLIKLAETVDALDRQMGLVGKYTEQIPRPEDVIFAATFTKVASETAEKVALTSGKVYNRTAFTKLALADLEALFGSDFAERVKTPLGEVDTEKFADEVATLPRPDAALLDGLLSDNGIAPVLTKAASARQGLSKAEMQHWAEAYATVR